MGVIVAVVVEVAVPLIVVLVLLVFMTFGLVYRNALMNKCDSYNYVSFKREQIISHLLIAVTVLKYVMLNWDWYLVDYEEVHILIINVIKIQYRRISLLAGLFH